MLMLLYASVGYIVVKRKHFLLISLSKGMVEVKEKEEEEEKVL